MYFGTAGKLGTAFHRNKISNLVSVKKSIKKVWTNNILHNICQNKIRGGMWFKWLPIFVKKKKFVKVLSKITSVVIQTEIQNVLGLNLWDRFMKQTS